MAESAKSEARSVHGGREGQDCRALGQGRLFVLSVGLYFVPYRNAAVEASALTWADVDLEQWIISISKSRYMGSESAPKDIGQRVKNSVRGGCSERVEKSYPRGSVGLPVFFLNKFGDPMNAKKWSEHNWKGPLKTLGIRHRKFYATRAHVHNRSDQARRKPHWPWLNTAERRWL